VCPRRLDGEGKIVGRCERAIPANLVIGVDVSHPYRQTSGIARSFLRVVGELLRTVSDRIESFSILTATRSSAGFVSPGFGIIGI